MADVFISYSRKDKEFVERLDEVLRQREREAWVDWEGIRPTEEFMQAIYRAIEGADTFIFILSPDSIDSEVCGKEVAHAVANNKRMVPIVAREVDSAAVPEALAKLNWIFFRESDDFHLATDTLIEALDTDLEWVSAHTRLLTRAVEWESKGKNKSLFLRGDDLREAESWLAEAASDKERQPTALQTDFIVASRKASARRLRITLGGVGFGAVVAVVLAIIALIQRSEAVKQEKTAKSELSRSEYLRASSLVASGDADEALQSLATAVEQNPDNREAMTRLINLLGQRAWPRLIATLQHPHRVEQLAATPDGRHLFVATGKPWGGGDELSGIHAWDLSSLRLMAAPQINLDPLSAVFAELAVNPTGDRLIAFRRRSNPKYDRSIELYDANTGRLMERWGGSLDKCFFSSDGRFILYSLRGQPAVTVVSAEDGKRICSITLGKSEPRNEVVLADLIDDTIYILDDKGRLISRESKNSSTVKIFGLRPPRGMGRGDFIETSVWAGVSPDRRSIFGLFKSKDGLWYVGRWNLADGNNEHVWGKIDRSLEYFNYWDASFDPLGQLTLMGSQWEIEAGDAIVLRTADSGLTEEKFSFQPKWISPQGSFIAVDGQAARVNLLDGGTISGVMRHDGVISAVCPIGKKGFATGTANGEVKIWALVPAALSLESLTSEDTTARHTVQHNREVVEVSRDGLGELRFERSKGTNRLSNITFTRNENGKQVKLPGPWEDEFITWTDAFFAPDCNSFAVVGHIHLSTPGNYDYRVRIFSTKDGTLLTQLYHTRCERAIFTSDSERLITIGADDFCVWDLSVTPPRQDVRVEPDVSWALADRNGQIFVTLSETGSGTVWNAKNLKPIRKIETDLFHSFSKKHERRVNVRPALSDDGRRLAAAFEEYVVIWDVASGKALSDPIDCGETVDTVSFRSGSSNEVCATLRNGSKVVWKSTDVSLDNFEREIASLTSLTNYTAGFMSGGTNLPPATQSDSLVARLVNHFRSFSHEQLPFLERSNSFSSEALASFWFEVAQANQPPDLPETLIQGLQQVVSLFPNYKEKVDSFLESWKRRVRRKIELDLAGNALRLPGKYEDRRMSERDAGTYLRAALGFQDWDPVLLSELVYLGQSTDADKKKVADWISKSENSLAESSEDDVKEAAQAWKLAQVWACMGKPELALKSAQMACDLDKANQDYWITQGVLLMAFGETDAASRALTKAVGLTGKDEKAGNFARLLNARCLIAQGKTYEGAQLSLTVSDEFLDLPLYIWTCDWLASKGRFMEALDRLLKLGREDSTAVDARIAACFLKIEKTVSAIPYIEKLRGYAVENALADMPDVLVHAWQKGKADFEEQQDGWAKLQNSNPSTTRNLEFDKLALENFLKAFERSSESNDPDAVVEFYAARVSNYFGEGDVLRDDIRNDRASYIRKWPQRSYALQDFDILSVSGESCAVRYTSRFRVSNSLEEILGKAITTMKLRQTSTEFEIYSIDQRIERLRPKVTNEPSKR